MSKPALSGVAAKPPAVAESRCQTCKPTASRKYDVYGAIRSGDSGTSAHKFVGSLGHPSEDNTGLIYMQARYMDQVTGRFVSEDTAIDTANLFAYVGNSPCSLYDSDGHKKKMTDATPYLFLLGMIFAQMAIVTMFYTVMSPVNEVNIKALGIGLAITHMAVYFFMVAAAGVSVSPEGSQIVTAIDRLMEVGLGAIDIAYMSAREGMKISYAVGAVAAEFGYTLIVCGTLYSIGEDVP